MASILPNAKTQFIDANGAPLALGKVYFYIPGTLTPKDTWQNSGLTAINSNPVELDAAGEAIIWGSGLYRQIVKDVLGNTVWDQVTSDVSGGGSTVIDVVSFGADPSGVNDSTDAINAAFAALRASVSAGIAFTNLLFAPGGYLCTGELNGTAIGDNPNPAFGWLVDGNGATILTEAEDGVGLDMLASRFGHVQNLHIRSLSTAKPRIGLQIGRRTTASTFADNVSLSNVFVEGYYTFAPFYNFAAETHTRIGCKFWNRQTGGASYCVVQDGSNRWSVSSSFVAVTAPVDTLASFTQNTVIGEDCRQFDSGRVYWMGAPWSHEYINCYAATTGGAAIEVYSFDTGGFRNLKLNIHCEGTGLQNAVKFTFNPAINPATQVVSHNFEFDDHNCFAEEAIFKSDVANSVLRLENPIIKLGHLQFNSGAGPVNGLFAPTSRFQAHTDHIHSVTNNTDLRNLTIRLPVFTVQTMGSATAFDGLGATWNYVIDSAAADDNATCIVDASGRRWISTLTNYIIPYRANISGAVSIDLSTLHGTPNLHLTMTGNVTSFALTNPRDGQVYNIRFIEDGTGGWTFAGFPAAFKFAGGVAPTFTTTANAVNFLSAQYGATEATYACGFGAGMA